MKKEDAQTLAGLCLPIFIFLVFLTLKLTSVIDWGWKWITSPLWITAAAILGLTVLYVIVFSIRYWKYRKL